MEPCRKAVVRIRKILATAFLLALGGIVHAQEQGSQALERTPPFSDPVLDGLIQNVLRHMDGFRADSSLYFISSALLHISDTDDPEALYYLLSYRAEVLYYEGLFNEAMKDLDKCMPLAEALDDSLLIANIHNLKGLLHENIQESREALPHLYAALRFFPKRPVARYPVTELFHIHGNLGSYLLSLNDLPAAKEHLELSLQLAERAKAGRATAVALWSLGILALQEHRPENALDFHTRSIEAARAAGDQDIALDNYPKMAEAHLALGNKKEALHWLELGKAHLSAHPNEIGQVTQRNFERRISSLYRALDRPEEALVAISNWHHMDSTISARNIRSALSTQAELLRSDQELTEQRLANEQAARDLDKERWTRNIILAGGLLLVLILTGVYLAFANRQRHMQRMARLELEHVQQEQRITAFTIREQVSRDMHDDLGAGLSALKLRSELTLRQEKDPHQREQLTEIARSANELIGSMRQIIWALDSDQGTCEDIVVYCSNYARRYLDEQGIKLVLDMAGPWPTGQLDTRFRRNVFLVLKEALHNVVKHAEASMVEYSMTVTEDVLDMRIRDNGIGLPRNAQTAVGNGLRNMHRRIEDLGGTMEWSVEGGTLLRARIPFPPANKGSIAGDRDRTELRSHEQRS